MSARLKLTEQQLIKVNLRSELGRLYAALPWYMLESISLHEQLQGSRFAELHTNIS